MACSIGRLPTAEPIESKLVNMLWPSDKNVALPAKGLICLRTENISISLGQVKLDWRTIELGSWGFGLLYCKLNIG